MSYPYNIQEMEEVINRQYYDILQLKETVRKLEKELKEQKIVNENMYYEQEVNK